MLEKHSRHNRRPERGCPLLTTIRKEKVGAKAERDKGIMERRQIRRRLTEIVCAKRYRHPPGLVLGSSREWRASGLLKQGVLYSDTGS